MVLPEAMVEAATFFPFEESSSTLLSFADQADNIAGPLFAGSLLPYLVFLGFINYKGNKVSDLAKFGYAFLLLFVVGTIPSAIVAKSVYGVSLANADWLHGSAEALLTITNLLLIFGLRGMLLGDAPEEGQAERPVVKAAKGASLAYGALAVASFFLLSGAGKGLGLPVLEAHTPFLGGLGDLGQATVASFGLPHVEPENALSVPTWAIHFSSVIEYVVAMRMVWSLAAVTGNPTWKGLTWGMLPLHASGVVACTYHLFYNAPEISFMVPLQAGLTLLGDTTCAIAAYRIAASNGWTPSDLNPFGSKDQEPRPAFTPDAGAVAIEKDSFTYVPGSIPEKVVKLVLFSLLGSYFVKYASLATDLPFTPFPPLVTAVTLAPPAFLAWQIAQSSPDVFAKSDGEEGEEGEEGKSGFSMTNVKNLGLAGTLSYFITELIFWILAIPGAAIGFNKATGHWPDFSSNQDRVAVLGYVFAASNVARAALPLRLGAAVAIAPWVDKNIVNRGKDEEDKEE